MIGKLLKEESEQVEVPERVRNRIWKKLVEILFEKGKKENTNEYNK